MTPAEISDAAIEILATTNDGDDLAPRHLKLIEHAVNDRLTEYGEANFAFLLANVRAGYTPAPLKLARTDPDNCRVYYRGPRSALYAIQDDGTPKKPRLALYCCADTGEPLWISHYPAEADFDPYVAP